ncbi:peroxisomal N(1)-acetyl-spermine/spermidine oxidase-like isoform X1 [Cheilinus undulatus]|uniref:peroxisomal N(1)-acetyl-spermine/spermidine oxidase-like isoform X1 n=2 Tax=Cheilinus undulatus TaxID=241271 RepID=UPI001BD53F9D|nr:peroxisomal N(1)-acetyl-spermine/spermidine oxidase-like isoform X1 [Cheilinus undulatus]
MAGNSDAEIVIIGSGISGLSAAHKLVHSGFDKVRILEATSRSGGRIQTANIGNVITEIGASYIHGASEQNPVFCLSLDYGLLDPEASLPENMAMEVDERPPFIPNYFSSSGQRLSAEIMNPARDLFNELMDDINEFQDPKEKPWPNIGHFLQSEARKRAAERWKHKDKTTQKLLLCAISAMVKGECTSNATTTMENIDIEGYCIYKPLPGLDCTFPGGFEGLVKKLMMELPADLVSYNRPVRCIHWNNTEDRVNTVTVECDDAEKITADHVIVTVSLGYLKKHHSTLFSPPLPAHKLLSIHKLGYGTCNKIYVEFDFPWWDDDCEIIYLVWNDEEDIVDHVSDLKTSWIRKLSTFTVLKHPKTETYQKNSHVLCGWISGHEAEHMETLTEQQLRQALIGLFHTFTGDPSVTPKRILRTQWFNDPWACGSFCYPAIGFIADDLKNMAEPLPTTEVQSQPLQVLFAGEATHSEAFSTVHGALLSGWREADRLINHYSSFSSSS